MQLNVTMTIDELKHLAEKQFRQDNNLMDTTHVSIELSNPNESQSFNINEPQNARVNKIALIKMIRTIIQEYNAEKAKGYFVDSSSSNPITCGLAWAKIAVEKYFSI